MKKTILAASLLFVSAFAFAQKQGDIFVEGSLDLECGTQKNTINSGSSSNSEKSALDTKFDFMVGASYFVIDNVRVGVNLGYAYQKSDDTKAPGFAINPNVAYYLELGHNFYYTPEFGLYGEFGSATTTTSIASFSADTKYNHSVLGAYLHILSCEYRINSSLALGVNFGTAYFQSSKLTDPDEKDNYAKNTTFGFDLGSASVGLRFYF